MKARLVLVSAVALCCLVTGACSTTQKTTGEGLTSAVAQNVVRIACVEALRDVDLSCCKGVPVEVKLTGFTDEKNAGILEYMFRSKAEQAGARIVPTGQGTYELEVGTLSAGNDAGGSSFPLITRSERVEGGVNVQMSVRNIKDGTVLKSEQVQGKAKYEQTAVVGIQGRGHYFVQNSAGKFVRVDDPATFQ